MSVIQELVENESAQWLMSQIDRLPDRGKYRAFNALRSLEWANGIFDANMPIPACFCALHATEEAVASFISCAKEAGYEEAKSINIKDHLAKATVSLVAGKIAGMLVEHHVAFALSKEKDALAVRYKVGEEMHFAKASMRQFQFQDDAQNIAPHFFDDLVKMFGGVDELKVEVIRAQEARNAIFYASSTGYPTGFHVPEESLTRECKATLGLVWAAFDVTENAGLKLPFYQQALETAGRVIDEVRPRK